MKVSLYDICFGKAKRINICWFRFISKLDCDIEFMKSIKHKKNGLDASVRV